MQYLPVLSVLYTFLAHTIPFYQVEKEFFVFISFLLTYALL